MSASIHKLQVLASALILSLGIQFCVNAGEAGGDLASSVAKVKMFSGLTDAEKAKLQAISSLHRAKAGEKIIEEGKPVDRMFFVIEGRIEVWLKGKCIESMGAQSLIGEFEFLDRKPASAEVRVTEDAQIVEIAYEAISLLMDREPRIGYKLMREIAKSEIMRILAGNTTPKN